MPTLTNAQRETFRRDMEAMQVRRLSETSRFASEQATSFADTVRGIVRIIKPVTKALRWFSRPWRCYPWRTRRVYRLKRRAMRWRRRF